MFIKIFYLCSLLFGSEVPDAAPISKPKPLLKQPSHKFNRYSEIDLSHCLDYSVLEINSPEDLDLFFSDLENHENYRAFMDHAAPFEEIDEETSHELRYHILLVWAKKNNQSAIDRQGYFPILSTAAIKNVYIPLAQLLKQGFRKDTPVYSCLWDICLTSLQEYLRTMVHNGNPYSPKTLKKMHHKIRYMYDKAILEKVANLEEDLCRLRAKEEDPETRVKFDESVSDKEGLVKSKRRNLELRLLVDRNQLINTFCYEIISADPNLLEQYKLSKEILYTLYEKYRIMYDFIYNSTYSSQIQMIGTFRFDNKTAMKEMRSVFDDVWKHYESEIDDWNDQQIADDFFPPLYAAFQQSLHSQDNPDGHALRRTTSVMVDLGYADDWSTLLSQPHAASSRRRSSEIPLISVNGQLTDWGQTEANH